MRPSKDQYFIRMAELVATRSTCLRRAVGCIGVNKRGHVLATGYNGVATGMPHCNKVVLQGDVTSGVTQTHPHACKGATSPSGEGLDKCQAIHAEQNMLLQCRDVFDLDTVYTTVSPCNTCTKLLLGTSCRRIVFLDEYPHVESKELWESSGRVWVRFKTNDTDDDSYFIGATPVKDLEGLLP